MKNLIRFGVPLDEHHQPCGPSEITITLRPSDDATIGEMFRQKYEIELLQSGHRRLLRNGQIEYYFELEPERATELRRAVLNHVFPLTAN